jgi:excisionase family DNA binding protein
MSTGKQASYTIKEVAALNKTSREHIARQIALGVIPSYKVGGARRIPAEAVDALMAGTTTPADDDLDAYVQRIVAAAPVLTPRQLNKLAAIVGGAK